MLHFCIGGDGRRDSGNTHVTVSNVVLYNRVLKGDELKALMKTKPDAVGTPEARVPAPKGAPQNNHASETFPQSASELVVMDEARQEGTSAPQRQHSPAQPSGNKKGRAVPMQTSSSDAIGPFTSADMGEVEEEAPISGVLAPALFPTPSVVSRQEVLETKIPVSGDRPEGGQEHSPSNAAASMMGQAGKANEGFPQNGDTDGWLRAAFHVVSWRVC
ncbi:trans-sialidase, putative, partial [Trypanosoma cruzi marinkellei]